MKQILALLALTALTIGAVSARERWSESDADKWYRAQPWPVGSNYLPANAINQLEMWQASTFDVQRIELELGWAQSIGMNTMRVFLHDLLWQQDPEGFKRRIGTFLSIAHRHAIKPLFVLFDSCWDPRPALGPQHPPIPGVHNSGWVQSPGVVALTDPNQYPRLEAYVKGVIGAFAKDDRVLGWDLWNEPDSPAGTYPEQPSNKAQMVATLLPHVYEWARSVDPIQPLTSGIWREKQHGFTTELSAIEKVQLGDSDILSFHNYGWPESLRRTIDQLRVFNRPIICTEYMARGAGSTFDGSLPVGKRANVGMINWGFVDGKEQTRLPWDSWQRPYTSNEPIIWFHDVLHRDGTPYRQAEVDLIRKTAAAPRGQLPNDSIGEQ